MRIKSLKSFLELKVLGVFSSGLGLNSFESCFQYLSNVSCSNERLEELDAITCSKFSSVLFWTVSEFFFSEAIGENNEIFLSKAWFEFDWIFVSLSSEIGNILVIWYLGIHFQQLAKVFE